jgi:hypothetical protein
MGIVGGVAFFLWAVVALVLYLRLPPGRATLWNFLGAQMWLPTGFYKFPMVLPIDKSFVPTLCAAIGVWVFKARPQKARSEFGLVSAFLVLYLLVPVLSALANSDTLIIGDRTLPAVGLYDGLSATEQAAFALLPFVFGRLLLRTSQDGEDFLRALVVSGLIYSVPMLFEVRFSPQLHYWIYGFYSSDFVQEIREGGYRPMVFMGHGLQASFFLTTTVIAATAFWRTKNPSAVRGLNGVSVTGYLGVVLLLCKSLGAVFYGLIGVPLVRLGSTRLVMRVAVLLSIISIVYPLLRAEGWFPTETILSTVRLYNDERERSLEYRFNNEDSLLSHASERIFTGWGRYGRNRAYDKDAGNDVSVTDGRWVIVLGEYGIFGFLAEFGILTYGIFRSLAVLKYVKSEREAVFLATLALILSFNVLDLLPNATLTPLTFLMAGALVGRTEYVAANVKRSSGFVKAPTRASMLKN